MATESTNPKDKHGKLKPQLHLIPQTALILEALAMQNGADKYGPFNWRDKSVSVMTYLGANLRHIAAYIDREDVAPDSLIHHLAHARASLGVLLDALACGTAIDDRPPVGKAGAYLEKYTRKLPGGATPSDPGVPRTLADIPPVTWIGAPTPTVDSIISGVAIAFTATYICGPMRGIPEYNFPAFDRAAHVASTEGVYAVNPAALDRVSGVSEHTAIDAVIGPAKSREFAARDLRAILALRAERGDTITVLPGWERSIGAPAEMLVARWLGLQPVDSDQCRFFPDEVERMDWAGFVNGIKEWFAQRPGYNKTAPTPTRQIPEGD